VHAREQQCQRCSHRTNRLHVWWARRPLTVSRAAVLASLLPADFDRAVFERLLGFYDVS
jgi:putative DNA methylase